LLEDMKAQGATVFAICNAGDERIRALAKYTVVVEALPELLLPICEVVPLQMFAYSVAVKHGVDVDSPRNLVKAVVTV